jgi:hypothetical protein
MAKDKKAKKEKKEPETAKAAPLNLAELLKGKEETTVRA